MPDIQADGWDWQEDDEWGDYGERTIPRVTLVGFGDNTLSPTPPGHWSKVIRYDSRGHVNFLDTAAWMCCLGAVQNWEQRHREGKTLPRLHMICRDPTGTRVLVVHPDLLEELDGVVETINGIFTGCNCGGYDCLEAELQARAAVVFTRRVVSGVDPATLREIYEEAEAELPIAYQDWHRLTISERLKAILYHELPGSTLYDEQILDHWLDYIVDHSSNVSAMLSSIYDAACYATDKPVSPELELRLAMRSQREADE